VAWFRRRKPEGGRQHNAGDITHLEQFIQSRRGVEAFIEPRTTMTETTVILIAFDGEWTRRRMPNPQAVRQFAQRWSIPVYDVQLVGYPQRMRDFNERKKRSS
jgi:hypothetical protein